MAIGRILRFGQLLWLCPVAATLTGCGLFSDKPTAVEQCADLMLDAYPDGDIDITHKSTVNSSITTMLVTIEGARSDIPPTAAVAHDVAVQCKFDHEVLVDFHWSKPPFR
ncbi:MAG: hypothetical protein WDN69_17885 [Aliidongia sp.]